MASPMIRSCVRLLQILESQSQGLIRRPLHTSYTVLKEENGDKSPPGNDQDKLLDAASKVASSMKGLEDEAFKDLANQLEKMDISTEEPAATTQSESLQKMGEFLKKPSLKQQPDFRERERMKSIVDRYKAAEIEKEVVAQREMVLPKTRRPKQSHMKEESKKQAQGTEPVFQNMDVARMRQPKKTENSKLGTKGTKKIKELPMPKGVRSKDATSRDQTTNMRSMDRIVGRLERKKPKELPTARIASPPARGIPPAARPRGSSDLDSVIGSGNRQHSDSRPLIFSLQHESVRLKEGKLDGQDLFKHSKPLNIFNPSKWNADNEAKTVPLSDGWKQYFADQLAYATAMPHNGFEEAIKLTKEGKLWQFPIDNEQGMDDENATPFYEHVFLDKHLGAFPKTGPIRGFMELVILGLGKNPHLSVKEKTDHIKWFEEYFREKQPLVPSQELLAEFEKDK